MVERSEVRGHSKNNIAATGLPGLLSTIDWSFTKRKKMDSLEGIHPYPAKFIPDIPASILDNLIIPNNMCVLDPFVGSGTTVVECQKRGIKSVGVDLNPIACLISRVKTSQFQLLSEDIIQSVLKRALNYDGSIPEIPNLDHWFKKDIQNVIARIVSAIANSQAEYRDILSLALSSILVRVSNQESDTRYAAIEKYIGPETVYTSFGMAVRKIVQALSAREYDTTFVPAILERDTLSLSPNEITHPVAAVITSPPYPNAYEYWLYHKYRMWWLGYDPIAVKAKEIGARAHFFKSTPHTADNFVEQMDATFSLIEKVLVPNGVACFVVGRSMIHGQVIDNANIIEQASKKYGYGTIFRTERVISSSRKSFNLSHANIKTETVLVFGRG